MANDEVACDVAGLISLTCFRPAIEKLPFKSLPNLSQLKHARNEWGNYIFTSQIFEG